MVKVLDDFLMLEATKEDCDCAAKTFVYICEQLTIPLVEEKTSAESHQEIVFLGVLLDTKSMLAKLPADKLSRYSQDLTNFLAKPETSLRELQSVIGKLQFATSVIPVGKPFLRRLIDGTKGRSLDSLIKVDPGMQADIAMWQVFLSQYNGVSVITPYYNCDNTAIRLYTDASDLGYGGVFGSRWIQGAWNPKWRGLSIAVRELYPIVALVGMFGHLWANQSILFKCDNQAIVAVINKQSARDPTIMSLLRPLVLNLMLHNVKFRASYIRSEHNTIADALSRFQEDAAMLVSYGLRPSPWPVPQKLLPQTLIPDD